MPQEIKVTLAQQAELVISVLPPQLASPEQWIQLAQLARMVEPAAKDQPVLLVSPERRAQQDRRVKEAAPMAQARSAQQDRRVPRASNVQRALRAAKDRRNLQDRRVRPVQEVHQVLRVPPALYELIQRSQIQQDLEDPLQQ